MAKIWQAEWGIEQVSFLGWGDTEAEAIDDARAQFQDYYPASRMGRLTKAINFESPLGWRDLNDRG